MAKILSKKAALTKNSILDYQDFETYSQELIPIEDDYEFIVIEEIKDNFLFHSGMKEYKVFTDKGIFYLQTSENSFILNDEQLFMKKGKIEVTSNFNSFNIKKHLLKLQTPTFERWDLYSSTEEVDSAFLNIFYDIKFVSLNNEEFAAGLLHYTAWHPIYQDVVVKIEPQGFRWTPVREV
jgi:hypothetical protein